MLNFITNFIIQHQAFSSNFDGSNIFYIHCESLHNEEYVFIFIVGNGDGVVCGSVWGMSCRMMSFMFEVLKTSLFHVWIYVNFIPCLNHLTYMFLMLWIKLICQCLYFNVCLIIGLAYSLKKKKKFLKNI